MDFQVISIIAYSCYVWWPEGSYVMFVWKLIVVDAPRSFLPGPVAKRAGIGTGIAAEVVGEDN